MSCFLVDIFVHVDSLKNVFEFQHLLGQNGPSMKVQQSSSGSLVEMSIDSYPTKSVASHV
jgi:hypothetical protein